MRCCHIILLCMRARPVALDIEQSAFFRSIMTRLPPPSESRRYSARAIRLRQSVRVVYNYWYGCRSCVIICPRRVFDTSNIGRYTSRVVQDTVYIKSILVYTIRDTYLPNILYYSHLDICEIFDTWRIITLRYS